MRRDRGICCRAVAATAGKTHEHGEPGGSGVTRYAVEHRRAGAHHKAGPHPETAGPKLPEGSGDTSRAGPDEREPDAKSILAAPGGQG